MSLNMQIAVTPLRPTRPRTFGLVGQMLQPLPTPLSDSERAVADRWLLGVKWLPWPTTFIEQPIDDCVRTLIGNASDAGSQVTSHAFRVTSVFSCSTLALRFEEARSILMTDAALYASPAIARHLMHATGATGNFVDDAVVLPSSYPVTRAIGTLEDKLNDVLLGALGSIFMPAKVLTTGYGALDEDDDGDEGATGLATLTGHSVAVDSAFGGAPADDPTVGADRTWIYGSGPLWGGLTSPHIDGDDWQHVDYTTNRATLQVQFEGLVAYDPSTVFAQKVCLPVCS